MPKSSLNFKPEFNMSSLTDIVFLLLIFFMLTSRFTTPSAVEVNIPTSEEGVKLLPAKLSITISKDTKYYINTQEVAFEDLKGELEAVIIRSEDKEAVLYADETTDIKEIVKVMGITSQLGIKTQLAVKD